MLLVLWFEEGDMIAVDPVLVPVLVICSWDWEAAAAGDTEEVIVSPRARWHRRRQWRSSCYHAPHRGRGRRWRAGPGVGVGIGVAPRDARAH